MTTVLTSDWSQETVDEMYHGEFDVGGCDLALNIQDTGGGYVDQVHSTAQRILYFALKHKIIWTLIHIPRPVPGDGGRVAAVG